jgi:ferredoxin/flavodoxin---NADP+ reductase
MNDAVSPKPAKPKKAPKPLIYNATVIERIDLTDLLAIFRVQPDPKEGREGKLGVAPFVAGQYAVLGANNEKEPEKGSVRRAYSIASPPEERRWLEFYIRYVQEPESANPLTHLLWDIPQGGRLWLGPKITGHFTLEHTVGEEDPRVKVFVAAGTGLAPFVSIIKNSMLLSGNNKEELGKYVVLHGASHPHDLGYKEDLQMVMNDVQERYFPTISRPQHSPDWQGDTGRVETFFDAEKLETLERRVGFEPGFLHPEKCVVYICGLQGTIAQTLIRLLQRGFVPDDRRIRRALQLPDDLKPTLFFEQYDSDPIIDLKNEEFLEQLRAIFPKGLLAGNSQE